MAASEKNKQQQLFEGFVFSCHKIVPPILLLELINDFAVLKHCSGRLLLVEDVAAVLESGTTHFKKEPRFLVYQQRTCRIFMLRCIKSIFLSNLVTSLVYIG